MTSNRLRIDRDSRQDRRSAAAIAALGCAACTACAACAGAPELGPLVPPALVTRVGYFAGPALQGPMPAAESPPISADPAAAWIIDCRVVYLERLPEAELAPLSASTKVSVGIRSADPILGAPTLARGARVGSGDAAEQFLAVVDTGRMGRMADVARHAGVLPAGVTARFVGTAAHADDLPGVGPFRRQIAVQVSRSTDPDRQDVTVSLIFERLVARSTGGGLFGPPGPDSEVSAEQPAPERLDAPTEAVHRELIVLDERPALDCAPLVLVFRSPFGSDTDAGAGFVASLRVRVPESSDPAGLPTAEDRAAEVARCLREVSQVQRDVLERSVPLLAAAATEREIERAFGLLPQRAHQRTALLLIASMLGVVLTEDVALVAEADLLGHLTDRLLAEKAEHQPRDIVWLLESTTYRFLAECLDDDELPPELYGTLLRHAGEAGCYPGVIDQALRASHDVASLRQRLVTENRGALWSSDPAARTRAFDWLVTHGTVPAGYDPLGPIDERRNALMRDAAAAAGGTDAAAGGAAAAAGDDTGHGTSGKRDGARR